MSSSRAAKIVKMCDLSTKNNSDESVSTSKEKTPVRSDSARINIIGKDAIVSRKLFNVDPETKVNNNLNLLVANVEKESVPHNILRIPGAYPVNVIENAVALPIFQSSYNEGNVDVFNDTKIVLLDPCSDQELLEMINVVTNEVSIGNIIPSTEFYENDAEDPTLQSISDTEKEGENSSTPRELELDENVGLTGNGDQENNGVKLSNIIPSVECDEDDADDPTWQNISEEEMEEDNPTASGELDLDKNVRPRGEDGQENDNGTGMSKLKFKKINKRKAKKDKVKLGHGKQIKPNPCNGKKCLNDCLSFSDEDRKLLFNEYYTFNSYEQQKNWLLNCMFESEIKRKRTKTEVSRRKKTIGYRVVIHGTVKKVCQQFLLKTLDISQMTLRHTLRNSTPTKRAKPDARGKHNPKNKTPPEKVEEVKAFIESIPVVPSHYCRKKCKRLYLPSEIGNLTNLGRLYTENCKEKNTTPVREGVFKNIFKQHYNLGFHVPKKDKCSHCERVKQTGFENLEEADKINYNKHKIEVEECKKKFLKDQENQDENFLCASFDLQKVLNTPCGKSMLLYYSRKIAVYNYTIYESKTKNVMCYIWDETQGKKGSNEICTALMMYLKDVDQRMPSIHKIAFYCDNCAGQNKNRQMLVMLHTFLMQSKNVKHISLNYLIAGHTYMPADSVHSTIDSFISNKIICAPSQWPTVISLARHGPNPYKVFSLSHTDIDDWSSQSTKIQRYACELKEPQFATPMVSTSAAAETLQEETVTTKKKSLKTTRSTKRNKNTLSKTINNEAKSKPLKISKISSVEMSTNSKSMFVKYSYLDADAEEQEFNFENHKQCALKKKYSTTLPISTAKYKDLQKLCKQNAIIKEYHAEYANFKHSNSIADTLQETDEEDEVPIIED